MTASENESALLTAAQHGDRDAMDRLLRQHQPQIYALCRRIAGNEADALDATQEALIAVVRGLPRFDGRAKLSTWVYRVATNACLDEVRRRNRRPVVGLAGTNRTGTELDGIDQELSSDPGSTLDPVADDVAERLDIDAALADLPVEFRAAVVLRDLCDLDYSDIASVLDLPPGTVRSRIARGRRRLAEHMAGNPDTPLERPTPQP